MKLTDDEGSIFTKDDTRLIERLTQLPRKILRYHDLEGLAELVLYDICRDSSFGVKKAAYLVDNPDFDHLVGVTGYSRDEYEDDTDIWDDPTTVYERIKEIAFRNKVRDLAKNSFRRREIDLHNTQDVMEMGQSMGMEKPGFLSWNMKHGNHGLLIFERDKQINQLHKGLLENVVPMLGLCGVH